VVKVTPFELVYGQEAVLPVEIKLQTHRVFDQDTLVAKEYADLMMDRVDEVHEDRLQALKEIEKEKIRMARAYNKKVKGKSFQIGGIV
jgi:hypothetical protein